MNQEEEFAKFKAFMRTYWTNETIKQHGEQCRSLAEHNAARFAEQYEVEHLDFQMWLAIKEEMKNGQ